MIDRLSTEDTQILKLGSGHICGHTCKVLVLERPEGRALPTLEEIRGHVEARLDSAPRFRQRVVATPLGVANPVWLDDPDFDITRHVTRVPADGAVSRSELEQIVARLMADRLDRSHPLWHLDLIEELEEPGSMALVWRVHHSVADGTTSVRLGSMLLWDQDPASGLLTESSWQPQGSPGAMSLLARGVADRASRLPRRARRAPGQQTSLSELRGTMERELRRSASLTPLAGQVGTARNVGFAAAPLEECKQAGKAIDESVTVNDVVLSIIAGAVRTWLGGEAAIRVKVPVSLHKRDEAPSVANHDSYFFVDLPVSEPDPVQRVLAINRETTERKLHHDAETLYRLGLHPHFAHWAMSPHVFTFNVSNVPGPRTEVFVLGARLRELYSLAEIAQHHALRMAVISATDSLFFGLCADREAVSDLRPLTDGLHRSTDELLALVG